MRVTEHEKFTQFNGGPSQGQAHAPDGWPVVVAPQAGLKLIRVRFYKQVGKNPEMARARDSDVQRGAFGAH